jgi:hypothetical protein
MRRNIRRWYALAAPAAAVLVIALARLSGNQTAEAADLDRRVPKEFRSDPVLAPGRAS